MKNLEMFIKYLKSERSSECTIKAYESDIKLFLNHVDKCEKEINMMDIVEYKNYLMENNADSTVNRKIVAINRFFQFLVDCDIFSKNPAEKVKTIKAEIVEKNALTTEQIRAIMNVAKGRDKAIFVTLLNTGLRVSELIDLTLEDIGSNGTEVVGKGRKVRMIYFNESCINAINEYLPKRKNTCDNLFVSNHGTPMVEKNINNMLKKLAKKANMEDVAEWITPHTCRRTFATTMAENGMSISTLAKAMGHSSITTTERYIKTHDSAVENLMMKGIV